VIYEFFKWQDLCLGIFFYYDVKGISFVSTWLTSMSVFVVQLSRNMFNNIEILISVTLLSTLMLSSLFTNDIASDNVSWLFKLIYIFFMISNCPPT